MKRQLGDVFDAHRIRESANSGTNMSGLMRGSSWLIVNTEDRQD